MMFENALIQGQHIPDNVFLSARIGKRFNTRKNQESRFESVFKKMNDEDKKKGSRENNLRLLIGSNALIPDPNTSHEQLNFSFLAGIELYFGEFKTSISMTRETAFFTNSQDRYISSEYIIINNIALNHYLYFNEKHLRLSLGYVSMADSKNDVQEGRHHIEYFANHGVSIGVGYPILFEGLEASLRGDVFVKTVNDLDPGFNYSRLRLGLLYRL